MWLLNKQALIFLAVLTPLAVFAQQPARTAVEFYIVKPSNSIVGEPETVTVEARTFNHKIDDLYEQDVTLVTGGSATGGGLVDIIHGVGALDVNDSVTETVLLSLSDTESTGLDVSSTQEIAFTPQRAVKFYIVKPSDGVVGELVTITVEALGGDNQVDLNYKKKVTLVTSGSATGGGMVNIKDGVGTVAINDSVAETVTLSLSDTHHTGLDVSSTQTLKFSSASVKGGAGGAGPVLPTTVIFSGQAFPGAKIIVVGKNPFSEIPIRQESVSTENGEFQISYQGILQTNQSYGLIIEDKNGRRTQTKLFNIDTVSHSLSQKDIFVPPTVDLYRSAVTKGDFIKVIGSAAPANKVNIQLDNGITYETNADNSGNYQILINTAGLSLGNHTLKANRQDKANAKRSDWSATKSFSVVVTVAPEADFNGDGIIDIKDWSVFLSRWRSGPETKKVLDLNRDGKIDLTDLSVFLRAYRQGR